MLIKNFLKLKVFSLVLLLGSCSKEFPEKRFSFPDWKTEASLKNEEKIYFALFGDFTSPLKPKEEVKKYQQGNTLTFKVGGKQTLKEYLKILRLRFENNLVLISTSPVTTFTNDIKDTLLELNYLSENSPEIIHSNYRDLAFFHRELNLNKDFAFSSFLNLVNSNVLTQKNSSPFLPLGASSEKIIEKGAQRLAFLSLNYPTDKISNKLFAIPGLLFEDPILSILKAKNKLKGQGITSYILTLDISTNCRSQLDFKHSHYLSELKDSELHCDESDPLLKFIKRLPPEFIDMIVLANPEENKGNQFLIGTLNNIPIIKLDTSGNFILLVEMNYDTASLHANKKSFKFWAPIKLCQEFVLSGQDCYLNDFDPLPIVPNVERPSDLALVPAKFL